jgi:hypothetical protein
MNEHGPMAVVDDIEFIDVVRKGDEAVVETVVTRRGPIARFWPFLVMVGCAAWVLGSTGGDSTDAADDWPLRLAAPISPMFRDQLGVEADDRSGDVEFVPDEPSRWAAPPLDRDPFVVRIPGAADRRVGTLDHTLVYVNSLGDPTVVSFETGDVYEIDVAAIRVHETFAVEGGEVRSLEGANPGLADATAQAIVFHTYRDVAPPGVDPRDVGRGPELCLSDMSCKRPDQGLSRRVVGRVEVERFDPVDHRDVAEILDTWKSVDRWLVAADGYRIPAPVGTVWVISPRGAGSSSANGVL